MGSIQILTKCCSQVIEDDGEIEDKPIIEQIPVIIEEKINESFRTIIPTELFLLYFYPLFKLETAAVEASNNKLLSELNNWTPPVPP